MNAEIIPSAFDGRQVRIVITTNNKVAGATRKVNAGQQGVENESQTNPV